MPPSPLNTLWAQQQLKWTLVQRSVAIHVQPQRLPENPGWLGAWDLTHFCNGALGVHGLPVVHPLHTGVLRQHRPENALFAQAGFNAFKNEFYCLAGCTVVGDE